MCLPCLVKIRWIVLEISHRRDLWPISVSCDIGYCRHQPWNRQASLLVQLMTAPCQTGRCRHYVLNLSIHLSFSYQTCEHIILKVNEPDLMPIGTSGPSKSMKWSTLGSGGQRPMSHGTEIGNKNSFGLISQEPSNEF